MLRFDGCQFIKKFLLGDVSLSKHEHFAIAVNKVARVSKSVHPANVFLFYFIFIFFVVQIYCFDALTLESKFSVLTYPVPHFGGQGISGVNIGYGPMAVGPRWLAYASNNPLLPNTGRLSPQSLTPPSVSPSTSPSNSNLMARYAVESSKQLAAGLINLGDMGYKTLSRYYQDFIPDGSSSPVSSNSSWKVGRNASHSSDTDIAGMVSL